MSQFNLAMTHCEINLPGSEPRRANLHAGSAANTRRLLITIIFQNDQSATDLCHTLRNLITFHLNTDADLAALEEEAALESEDEEDA